MQLSEALIIANKYKAHLAPFCDRIEIAGSIRRQKPEVKDIELVAIPIQQVARIDLFSGVQTQPVPGFIQTVNMWHKIKGEATGKYTQRSLVEGINLDLFIATRLNWGLIFAIRTGSVDYSHHVLANGWTKLGYKSEGGILRRDGHLTIVKEEADLFNLLGIPYVEPQLRNL
jgi:DNA polymerase/3'-5' exonuclease PolX